MGNTFFFAWEPTFMVWLQAHLGSFGEMFASLATMFGEEIILVAILGFLYWSYDKRFGVFVGTNIIVALVWNPMIKNLFLRRRPYFDVEQIQCLRPVDADSDIYDIAVQGFSFPSGHSTNAVAVYASLPFYKRRKWLVVIGVLMPLLIGLSRVCLGVHYPTDVLAGWLLGIVVVFLISWLQSHMKRKWIFYGVLTLLALPGCFYCSSHDYYTALGMMIGFFAGNLFEEKYVCFEDDHRPLPMILRFVGGIAIFLSLNFLLKLPFSEEFLNSATWISYAVRVFRYAVILFLDIGIYPMLFEVRAKKT